MHDPLIEQRLREIEAEINSHNLRLAHNKCVLLLRDFPGNMEVQRFVVKIGHNLELMLKDEIDQKIKALKPLWKEQKYRELLGYYQSLKDLMPNHPVVLNDLRRLQEILEFRALKRAEDFLLQSRETITELYKRGDYVAAIENCKEFFKFDRSNKKILKLYQKSLKNFIKAKIHTGKQLINDRRYKEALEYFEKLFRLDPTNSLIKKKILCLQNIFKEQDLQHKKEMIDGKFALMERILSEKKYDEALRLIEEILLINSNLGKARRKKIFLLRKLKTIIEDEVLEQMLRAHRALKDEYRMKRPGIVKI